MSIKPFCSALTLTLTLLCLTCSAAFAQSTQLTFTGNVFYIHDDANHAADAGVTLGHAVTYTWLIDLDTQPLIERTISGSPTTYTEIPDDSDPLADYAVDYFQAELSSGGLMFDRPDADPGFVHTRYSFGNDYHLDTVDQLVLQDYEYSQTPFGQVLDDQRVQLLNATTPGPDPDPDTWLQLGQVFNIVEVRGGLLSQGNYSQIFSQVELTDITVIDTPVIPEPHEWLLIIGASAALLYAGQKRNAQHM